MLDGGLCRIVAGAWGSARPHSFYCPTLGRDKNKGASKARGTAWSKNEGVLAPAPAKLLDQVCAGNVQGSMGLTPVESEAKALLSLWPTNRTGILWAPVSPGSAWSKISIFPALLLGCVDIREHFWSALECRGY